MPLYKSLSFFMLSPRVKTHDATSAKIADGDFRFWLTKWRLHLTFCLPSHFREFEEVRWHTCERGRSTWLLRQESAAAAKDKRKNLSSGRSSSPWKPKARSEAVAERGLALARSPLKAGQVETAAGRRYRGAVLDTQCFAVGWKCFFTAAHLRHQIDPEMVVRLDIFRTVQASKSDSNSRPFGQRAVLLITERADQETIRYLDNWSAINLGEEI